MGLRGRCRLRLHARTVAERQLGVHVDGVSRAGLSTMVKRSFESITVSTFINS